MNQRIYFSASNYFKEKYNKKFKRVPIDAGFSCPGRCIYCSSGGSLAYNSSIVVKSYLEKTNKNIETRFDQRFSIEERFILIKNQIEEFFSKNIDLKEKKRRDILLYLYFQAFSNTFDNLKNLKIIYDYSLSLAEFDGFFIGTRADCIDKEKAELISSYSAEYDVWVELGLQSSNEKTLRYINRKHDIFDYEKAVKLLKSYNIKIISHIIIGLDDENLNDLVETVKFINNLGVDGVKFHNLYILPNTEILKYYEKGIQKVLTEEEYIYYLSMAIQYLKKDIIIFRLFSDPEKGYIAPKWSKSKIQLINQFEKYCKENDIYQGKLWN